MKKTKRPVGAFLGVLACSFALYFAMMAIQPHLPHILFDYGTWYANAEHSALWRFLWAVGDTTEPHFHKAIFGAVGVALGSLIAHLLDKKGSKHRGIPISYGTGLWPWIFCAGVVTLGISNILFGGIRYDGAGYIPTFVCYVSVASSVILLYGGNLRTLLTGSVLGALTTTPVAIFLWHYVMTPWELPGVIAYVSSMCLGGIITYEICRYLPWMKQPEGGEVSTRTIPGEIPVSAYKHQYPGRFFVRRMLADFTEPMFAGSEIAGAGLLLGSLLTWCLNPDGVSYGSGLFPAILLCELLTASLALFIYWDGWMEGDFCATFVGIVSVAPSIVCTYGGSLPIVLIASVFGALACTPIANWFNAKIPGCWHPMVGFTFSMGFCTLFGASLIKALLLAFPAIGG